MEDGLCYFVYVIFLHVFHDHLVYKMWKWLSFS